MNTDIFGIEHTGQIGDVIIGTFMHKADELTHITRTGYHSARFLSELNKYILPDYSDKDRYMIFVRGMIGVLSSHMIRRNYVEVASPFLNVELMEFCLSLPIEYRIDHKIYFKWIKKKYPGASKYVWEKTGMKPGAPNLLAKSRKFIKRCAMFVVRRTFLKKYIKEKSMNPMHVWYEEKPQIKMVWDNYFNNTINSPAIKNEKVRDNLREQYCNGTVIEKMQTLTALGAIKYYFC